MMREELPPSALAERHTAFLHALAQRDREGAMRQVEAILAETPEMSSNLRARLNIPCSCRSP